jgi:hypothetical protein
MVWMLAILGVIFLCYVAYMVIRGEAKSWFAPRENPPPATGYKPSIRPSTPNKVSADLLLTFKGDSAQRTEHFFLDCAIYRIEYQFPPDKKVKLELVSADGDNRTLLANKAGFDSSTFHVQTARYYFLDVAPEVSDTH